jgi:hypothetical protein
MPPPPLARTQSPSHVLEYRSAEGDDVLSWSNWREKKDFGLHLILTIWMLIWVPMTFVVTVLTWRHTIAGPGSLFVAFAWLGLIAGSTAILRLAMRETIRVRDDVIELTLEGLGYKRQRVIKRSEIQSLSLEKIGDESVYTLNLFLTGTLTRRRVMLAYSLSVLRKGEVFAWLKSTLQARGYDCEFTKEDGR